MADYVAKLEEDEEGYEMVNVYYGEEVVFQWNDEHGCPEDMIWRRDIGCVFDRGVELGKRIANDSKEEK